MAASGLLVTSSGLQSSLVLHQCGSVFAGTREGSFILAHISRNFSLWVAGEVDGADQCIAGSVFQVRCSHVTESGARGWVIN